MPPLTQDEIDAVIRKALTSPQSVEVDGKKVVNWSAEELGGFIGMTSGATAKANSVMHISRCSPGGSPVD